MGRPRIHPDPAQYRKEYAQKWYLKNREECKRKAKENYDQNKDAIQSRERGKRVASRLRCFNAYGGPICACCGETQYEFLTIDHINGGGNKHRREIGKATLYKWLEQHGYPDGFRVLCYNCNCVRGHYGFCPHELNRQDSEDCIIAVEYDEDTHEN